jgi:catechol 2,3-dioxygenase-like lactoylglutathione lyase family enzyme
MYQRAHHVGITVSDLARSIAFYHDTLGLPFALAPTDWAEDDHLPEALGVAAPVKLRLAAFKVAEGGTIIELLQYALPPSERDRALLQNDVGACHIALLVDDIDAHVAQLRARGVPFNSVVHDIEEGPFEGWRWVYFKDPDGHTIELVELRWQNQPQREADIEAYLAARAGGDPVASARAEGFSPA